MTALRILFVDDYPDDILLAETVLRRDGLVFERAAASTLEEATELFRRESWSVVVSDYNLGSATGLQLLRFVRGEGSQVPFILLSGTIGEERAVEVIREGASDYVMKDGMARLASVIRRELDAVEARMAQQALEERLRRAEERYRRTFEQAPLGIANASIDGRFLSLNEEFCALLGYSEHEIVGRHYLELLHPDDREDACNRIEGLLSGREAVLRRHVRRYLRKDGSDVWATATITLVRTAAGEPDYFIGCIEDVTQQRQAHEKVLLQARLLECVEQAVIATDVEGNVVYWNAFAERLYGVRANDALGRPVVELTSSEETREGAADVLARLQRGESVAGELALRRADGSTFPAYLTTAPIFDDRGVRIGLLGISFDLTPHKRTENELREHKLQLAEAQQIASIGSWTYDFATGERTWSDSIARMVGAGSAATMTVHDIIRRVVPEDLPQLLQVQRHFQETREPAFAEFRIDGDQGRRHYTIRARYDAALGGGSPKGIGVLQDVTEVKLIEEELRRRTAQQTAVANLGQVALSGAPVPAVLDQAMFLLRTLLHADLAEVFRCEGEDLVLVAGDGWEEREIGMTKPAGAGSQAAYTIAANAPVVVENVALESRFVPSPLLAAKGVVSGVTVVIDSGDGSPWGVLGVHATSPRTFAASDVEFLRSMANVLGQAIARGQADAELRTRARQQSAIASLGRLVLNSVDSLILDRVSEILVESVDADFGFINELTPEHTLRKIAGRIWTDLPNEIPVHPTSQAGFAILTGEPVIVDDYRTETRFRTFDATVPHGILSGAMVPVASARRTFGVLSAQSRRAGHFRTEHIDFLQSLANTLADALEREHARLAVQESEERYRRIFEGASEIIFTIDPSGRVVKLNPAFAAITGWTCEEWLGRPFGDLVIPDDRARVLSRFRDVVATGTTASAETTLLGRDRLVVIDVQSFPKIENGAVTEVYGFARDVTDARSVAAERERVTRSLELLLESTIEGIYTIDLAGNCTMVNRAAAAFYGASPAELLGRRVHDLLHARTADGSPRDIDDCPINAVMRTAEPASVGSDVFSRRDGTLIPVAYSAAPIVDGGQLVGAVVTFNDLSERRQLEAKLEQATRLSSLGRLAATVAHEFNNVLMGISPFVQVIQRGPSKEKVLAALEHINTSVKRGRRVTEDILRFTQPGEPALAQVDVSEWLESVAGEARPMIGPKYRLAVESEPVSIHADASQLHQIFMNLILNARDAMPAGGSIGIRARCDRSDARFAFGAVNDPSRFVHFTVTDGGCGMAEETLRHAFEPLFTTKPKGTGLGLAVTHQVVQRHGGQIFIESAVGEGTTFHLFLPKTARPASAAAEGAGEQPHAVAARHLLLVEDDPAVAAGLATLLECEGFAVRLAATGAEALHHVRQELPDAVILDIGLPDMDGQTVFAGIASLHPKLPIVFSTGHTDRSQLEELIARPNVGYLLKPYDADALMEELTRTMAGEGQERGA